MSAFLVSDAHIDTLVHAILHPRPFSSHPLYVAGPHGTRIEDPTAIGRMLLRENMLSLKARYNDRIDRKRLAAYRYREPTMRLSDAALAAVVACYEYQSCEHDGWAKSEAFRVMHRVLHELVARMPGYEQADWGVYA